MDKDYSSATRRRTKRIIQDAFLKLLEEMSFEQITVKMLCDNADINRATFYRYYPDLYALNDELAENLFLQLFTNLEERSTLLGENEQESILQYVHEALTIIEENRHLCYILLNNPTGAFILRLQDAYHLEQEADIMINYMVGGITSAVRAWLISGCEAKKDILAEMLDHSFMAAYGILKKLR